MLGSVQQMSVGWRGYATAAQSYDVVVVGGGMVGMALAAALGSDPIAKHLSVAVLDRAPVKDTLSEALPAVPNARVSTITPSSMKLFKQIGAWDDIASPRSTTFQDMQVWDASGRGFLRWNSKDVGLSHMGSVAENHVIQSACYRVAQSAANVDFVWPTTVKDLNLPAYTFTETGIPKGTAHEGDKCSELPPGSLAKLELVDGTSLSARLVIAADGGRSALRSMAGLRTMGMAYNQHGLVATVACEDNRTAWQRFLPTGPIALLPIRDGFSNIVWSTTPDHARRLSSLSPAEFAAEVNEALQSEAQTSKIFPDISKFIQPLSGGKGKAKPPIVHGWAGDSPRSFPLHLQHAGQYIRPRFALIGDAAHAVHPLAGQGVNLGFGDVSQLLGTISAAVKNGNDIGDIAMLQAEYERPRMLVNTGMMTGLHTLQRLFGTQVGLLVEARNAGMQLVNQVGPIRNKFMKVAMGK